MGIRGVAAREGELRGVQPHRVHDATATYVYDLDREWELETLADPRMPALLGELGVHLISYHQLARAVEQLAATQA